MHHGTIESGDTVGLNLGGTHTFHADSQILMSAAPIGIYEGGNVTFGGSQMVAEDINNSGTVTVDSLLNIGPFVNHGIVTVNEGKTLWTTQYRQPSEDAWTDLAGPTAEILLADDGAVTLEGGLLEGSGKITGDLVNTGGYVSPTGEMDVTGNYTQGAAATLGVETDGDAVDRLTVAGAATLDGHPRGRPRARRAPPSRSRS